MSYNKEKLKNIIKNYNYSKNKWQIFTKKMFDNELEENFKNDDLINKFLDAEKLTDNILNQCKNIEFKKTGFSTDTDTILLMLIYKKYFNSIDKNDDERKYNVNDKNKLLNYVDGIYLSEDELVNRAKNEAVKKEAEAPAKKAGEEAVVTEEVEVTETKEIDSSKQETMKTDLEELLKEKGLEYNSTIGELIDKLPMDENTLSLFTQLYDF